MSRRASSLFTVASTRTLLGGFNLSALVPNLTYAHFDLFGK